MFIMSMKKDIDVSTFINSLVDFTGEFFIKYRSNTDIHLGQMAFIL